ncbi:MAG: hypothetical protein R6T83_03145 [Salinibacter sp.]
MDSRSPGDVLNRLVDQYWTTVARHAWRQYQNRGRGAIVFTVDPSAPEDERTPLRYLTFTDEEAAKSGAFSKLHELVETYEPEREVVVAAVLPDEQTVFDVQAHSPPPSEAA